MTTEHVRTGRTVGVLTLLPALLAGLLVGCTAETDEQAMCDWMSTTSEAENAGAQGHTTFLVDTTASLRGTSPSSGGVDQSKSAAQHLDGWLSNTRTWSVAAFGGPNDIRWPARNLLSRPNTKDNEDNRKRRAASVSACVRREVAAAQTTVPRHKGTDLLGAIREAATDLAAHKGVRRLVVFTDGLPTTGCANLTESRFEGRPEIDAIAQSCLNEQEITSSTLASVETVFVGLGRTAEDQPQVRETQKKWIGSLWETLCASARPKPPQPTDCLVTTLPATEPLDTKAGTRPEDPVPVFPRRTYSYAGANAFFAPNSSVLLPEALPVITKIAVELRDEDASMVQVFGFVDPRGGSANNRTLSQARADAVKQKLEGLGVEGVTAIGKGVATDCPGAKAPLTKKQKLQCDRRVDIVVDPPGRNQ
ncbi:OmpA family protein [Streptomyces sp. NPDC093250]|uniref:OmpA family protein n=1 Tax=Streptomyces sp. NPDC093250 TaxID=3366036 RepID=UPI0037F67ACA